MVKYLIIFEKSKTGYSCYVPDLDGCVASGKTKAMAEKNILDAIQFHLEGLKLQGLKIPKSTTESELIAFAV